MMEPQQEQVLMEDVVVKVAALFLSLGDKMVSRFEGCQDKMEDL